MIFVVLLDGHVHGVYTSPVDAHLQAKPLNATVEVCRLNSEVTARPPWTCDHESLSPDCVINSDGSGSGPCE